MAGSNFIQIIGSLFFYYTCHNCLELCEHWQKEVKNLLNIRSNIMSDPASAIKKLCKNKERVNTNKFLFHLDCQTQINWRQQGYWKNICHSMNKRYPRRHYLLKFSCAISGKKAALPHFSLSWKFTR